MPDPFMFAIILTIIGMISASRRDGPLSLFQKGEHYPAVVAATYAGLAWYWGLTASAP